VEVVKAKVVEAVAEPLEVLQDAVVVVVGKEPEAEEEVEGQQVMGQPVSIEEVTGVFEV